jgi:hypothetical protein
MDIEMCAEQTELNSGQLFFMLFGMAPFLFLLPCWVVGKFIHEPYVKKCNEEYEKYMEEINKPPPYEFTNPLNDGEPQSKKTKINNIVVDSTPDGYVAMRYNEKEEGFEYWSDKNIAYKYLETVARKYVNSFGCVWIYINRRELLRKKMQKLSTEVKKNIEDEKNVEDENVEDENVEDENVEEDVFVNLKNYNSSSQRTSQLKKKITREDFVADSANKYIKKGKFKDSKEWMSHVKETVEDTGYVSWLSWKNSN